MRRSGLVGIWPSSPRQARQLRTAERTATGIRNRWHAQLSDSPRELLGSPSSCAPVVRIEVGRLSRMPNSVPNPCHDGGETTVMSSHSKALQTAYELDTSRSGLDREVSS